MKTFTDEEIIKFLEHKIDNAQYNNHIINFKEIVHHAKWTLNEFKRLIKKKKTK